MEPNAFTHLIAVGACYIDTILTVPSYPAEDEKQRASSISKRRGGNCPNTLEVLQQLFSNSHPHLHSHDEAEKQKQRPQLVLLSTLPAPDSADTKFIVESFNFEADSETRNTIPPQSHAGPSTDEHRSDHPINLQHVFHRDPSSAASSYIIQSQSTNTRTIVNHNALDEMTVSEFQNTITTLISPSPNTPQTLWIHFEGRIPETTLECMRWLRSLSSSSPSSNDLQPPSPTLSITISVECEKPNRPGLEALAEIADVVFYSKSWAQGQGHTSASACLVAEAARISSQNRRMGDDGQRGYAGLQLRHGWLQRQQRVPRQVTLCCTWGEDGASLLRFEIDLDATEKFDVEATRGNVVSRPAWSAGVGVGQESGLEVVDTIGAGDTWIAGMLFGFVREPDWDASRRVEFANQLAGKKITREGFQGLGVEMANCMNR